LFEGTTIARTAGSYSINDTSLRYTRIETLATPSCKTHISHVISLSYEGISISIFSDNFWAGVDKICKYVNSIEVQN